MYAAMLQCLLGLECEDFTMIAADQSAIRGLFIIKNDCDKLVTLSNNLIMGVNGDYGDIMQFTNFVSNNLSLYELKNNYALDTAAAVHFTRKTLADSFKNSTPYMMNFLIGGWDEKEGGQLYIMDYMASCMRVPFACHGFAGICGVSIIQYHYDRNMTESQAFEVIQMCIKEIHHRLFLNLPNFIVKVVSKNGVRTLPIIFQPRVVASPGLHVQAPKHMTQTKTKDSDKKEQRTEQKDQNEPWSSTHT